MTSKRIPKNVPNGITCTHIKDLGMKGIKRNPGASELFELKIYCCSQTLFFNTLKTRKHSCLLTFPQRGS